jgi:hypothetical protein
MWSPTVWQIHLLGSSPDEPGGSGFELAIIKFVDKKEMAAGS